MTYLKLGWNILSTLFCPIVFIDRLFYNGFRELKLKKEENIYCFAYAK